MKQFLSLFTFLLWCIATIAQQTYPYNGVLPKDVTSVAFTHATVYVDYQTKLEDATLIIEKGKVVQVGKGIAIPANAVEYDMKGKFIYPSFIDLNSDYGMPSDDNKSAERPNRATAPTYNNKGAFGWNPAIHAESKASLVFDVKEEDAKALRALGFGTVLTHKQDGISRGTSALVSLGDNANIALIKADAAAHYSFSKGSSTVSYPSSLMGSIALLRQTYYDAQWYKDGGHKEERNLSLEAFNATQSIPQIFEANDKWNILRADKVGDEFGVQYIFKTGGNEYQRIAEIKATKGALIVPLNFPEAYDVSDPLLSKLVSLDEMKHWELAPSNCAMLAKEQIPFAITASGLHDKSAFLKNLRKAVSNGLREEEALKALTWNPATFIKAENEVGKLQKGYYANFIITSQNIFEEGAIIYDNWVQGKPYTVETSNTVSIKGKYTLKLPNAEYALSVKEDGKKLKGEITVYAPNKKDAAKQDTLSKPVTLAQTGNMLTLSFEPGDTHYTEILRLSGSISDDGKEWKGTGERATAERFMWSAIKTGEADAKKEVAKDSTKKEEKKGEMIFPFMAYGNTQLPTQETVLIKNATIWTCDEQGVIENGQILISNGKIVSVGKTIDTGKSSSTKVIDAQGKHVSPGIIDEHSHIALTGVNEGSQASSAEVQQASVVYPEDINIYRQLSGGVTCSQLLHGSANPIGGQSALVKLKWGTTADEMLVKDAPKFIKFALGENVKQSNWGVGSRRFPQTRMGVEQVYYDHFIRAREYGEAWKSFNAAGKKNTASKPRRDLEMDCLYEILTGERFITCHSYVQSEINMLMHVADSMKFRLNTFTHILEGYKVADKMKAHGSGASTFSDWWAYKFEVKDAIPHNAAIMYKQGLTVAINSDDPEMGRRLNQEAAKAVKYGGVPEEDALKMVTINPAKLLHIDKRTGSLAAGKDADLVIWSDNPLSIYARVEKTFVEGTCYYDVERDEQMRLWNAQERARIIQKMLNAKEAGEPVKQPVFKHEQHFHCDTLEQTEN
jgi:imidazolonepropionase-like amidohydrolase